MKEFCHVHYIGMLHLEVMLTHADDIENCITDAVYRECKDELRTLQAHLHHEFRLKTLLGPIVPHVDTHLPAVLHRLTSEGQSVLGHLLAGDPVTMSVCGSATRMERNDVLSNVLTLLLPWLSAEVLADLMSEWSLTDGRQAVQRALCEYYLQASRSYLQAAWCSVPSSDLSNDEQRAHHFVRALHCMLTLNCKRVSWFGRGAHRMDHRHPLTKRYGLLTPDLDDLSSSDALLDVSFAVWYLSSQDKDNIADAFEVSRQTLATSQAPPKYDHGLMAPTKAVFVRVLMQRSFDILQAVAPHCAGCDDVSDVHCGGGCGTRDLIACLVPMHALQLLEMLVCDKLDSKG